MAASPTPPFSFWDNAEDPDPGVTVKSMGNDTILDYLRRIGFPEVAANAKGIIYRCVCPLHANADNDHGLLIFSDGYACMTGQCHKDRRFGNNLHGLVRALVHRVTGEVMAWRPAWEFAKANKPKLRAVIEECKVRKASTRRPSDITKHDLLRCLSIPDQSFIRRGFRPETLLRFGIGRCLRNPPGTPDNLNLLGWTVVPVHDENGVLGGFTARSPWTSGPKWLHGLARDTSIFNIDRAARTSGPLVIVEGPACVLRLHEAGYDAVATLGAWMSDEQYEILRPVLADRQVFIAGDNDAAGREFNRRVSERLAQVCDPTIIAAPAAKDFGDLPTAQVQAVMDEMVAALEAA